MTLAHNQGGPCIGLQRSWPSEVAAISPFVDKLMLLIRKCGCVPEAETDVEIALREALANAIIHGNHENPQEHVYVRCCCKRDEVAIAVKDERRGFNINNGGSYGARKYRIGSWPWHLPDESVDG
jgi:anti-sigma regulatory factor (Ser/Thr protein kinase)